MNPERTAEIIPSEWPILLSNNSHLLKLRKAWHIPPVNGTYHNDGQKTGNLSHKWAVKRRFASVSLGNDETQ